MPHRISAPNALSVLVLTLVFIAPVFSQEQKKDSAGIIVSGKIGSKDVSAFLSIPDQNPLTTTLTSPRPRVSAGGVPALASRWPF